MTATMMRASLTLPSRRKRSPVCAPASAVEHQERLDDGLAQRRPIRVAVASAVRLDDPAGLRVVKRGSCRETVMPDLVIHPGAQQPADDAGSELTVVDVCQQHEVASCSRDR